MRPTVAESPPVPAPGDAPSPRRLEAARGWLIGSPGGGMPGWVVVAFALAGVVLRIWVLRSPLGDADSDEAITGLMAMHALHGHFRALYWGANYAGTFEVLLTAGVFAVFGPSTIALKSVPIGLSAIAAVLVWRVGREYFDDQAGRLAAIVFWIFPGATVLLLMKAQVVYASGTCFILVSLLLARRLRERPDPRQLFLLGLMGGLCLWATPLLLTAWAPIAATVVARTWRKPLANLAAVAGGVLGALPWIWYSLTQGWATLEQQKGVSVHTTYLGRLKGALADLYPLLLGLRKPLTLEWIVTPALGWTLYAVIFVGMLVVAFLRYRAKVLPLLAPVVAFPFLYAIFSTSWYWIEPRHGSFVSPVLLLLGVGLVPRRWPIQLLVGVLALALTVNVIQLERDYGVRSGSATIAPGELGDVIRTMEARGLDTCYADYWIAYRIDFESDEDIICPALDNDRYPPYVDTADRSPTRAYLFLPQTPQAIDFARRLDQLQIPYDDLRFENVRMFVLETPKRPSQLG
jgi:hypothetical protein